MTIREHLSAALQEAGVTQEAAAEAIGVTRGTLNRMLNGRRTLSTEDAQKLADLAGHSLSEIVRRAEVTEAA